MAQELVVRTTSTGVARVVHAASCKSLRAMPGGIWTPYISEAQAKEIVALGIKAHRCAGLAR